MKPLIADGIPRRLVSGASVGQQVYEFPHLHPETDCAICAFLTRQHFEREYNGMNRPTSVLDLTQQEAQR